MTRRAPNTNQQRLLSSLCERVICREAYETELLMIYNSGYYSIKTKCLEGTSIPKLTLSYHGIYLAFYAYYLYKNFIIFKKTNCITVGTNQECPDNLDCTVSDCQRVLVYLFFLLIHGRKTGLNCIFNYFIISYLNYGLTE